MTITFKSRPASSVSDLNAFERDNREMRSFHKDSEDLGDSARNNNGKGLGPRRSAVSASIPATRAIAHPTDPECCLHASAECPLARPPSRLSQHPQSPGV